MNLGPARSCAIFRERIRLASHESMPLPPHGMADWTTTTPIRGWAIRTAPKGSPPAACKTERQDDESDHHRPDEGNQQERERRDRDQRKSRQRQGEERHGEDSPAHQPGGCLVDDFESGGGFRFRGHV
jgi:hypothetical protein